MIILIAYLSISRTARFVITELCVFGGKIGRGEPSENIVFDFISTLTVVERKRALKNDRIPCAMSTALTVFEVNPFGTAVPCWGQTAWNLSGLSPQRDCSTKRVNRRPPERSVCTIPKYTGQAPGVSYLLLPWKRGVFGCSTKRGNYLQYVPSQCQHGKLTSALWYLWRKLQETFFLIFFLLWLAFSKTPQGVGIVFFVDLWFYMHGVTSRYPRRGSC